MNPLVIVGTGLAGYSLAREFRKLDATTPLLLLSRDGGEYYSKPMLSNALAQGMSPAQLASADAERMAAQLKATIRTHAEVAAIDTTARTLEVNGTPVAYSRLVLALGAQPLALSAAGDGLADVLTVNSLADYARYHAAVTRAGRVAVIGPGLIGCEFANDLRGSGREVTVIGPDAAPLGRLLPPRAGAAFRLAFEAAGIGWRLGTTAQRIARTGDGYALTLADGAELTADLVFSAIGLRPNTALAAAAGLQVRRGIVTDRYLRTSADDVYALGDCAEVDGLVLPYVMPIMHAARALARTLHGEATRVTYPAMPVLVKTPAHPVVVAPPPAGVAGDWQEEVVGSGVKALFLAADGGVLGFVLTGSEAVTERQRLTALLPPLLT
jgi:rubredoxin-NAD+ reductase